MYCVECGEKLKKSDKVCPQCGHEKIEIIEDTKKSETEPKQEQTETVSQTITERNRRYKEFGSDTNLILGIIELICCGGIFGLIAILLNEFMMKKALDNNDLAGARQANTIIRVILVLGVVLGFLGSIFYLFLALIVG